MMEVLLEHDPVVSLGESGTGKTPVCNRDQQVIEDNDDDDSDAGKIKVLRKCTTQLSTSESDDDRVNEGVINKSDDESRVHKSNQVPKSKKSLMIENEKHRIQQFSDSDSECDKENNENVPVCKRIGSSSSSEEDLHISNNKQKHRIKIPRNSGSSDLESSADEGLKNEQQQLRMKNKRNKLKEKFKGLITSRSNELQSEKVNSCSGSESEREDRHENNTELSDHEEISIEFIKQNNKNTQMSYKITICDPDTSDEENVSSTKSAPRKKNKRKTTKLTSPKPVRMTAKQAMENMKKIKSESNRMLREKEVTLPYHRPKALSLKDIMSRRKPAVSSDGKSLPIKMNEEQLKQYAKMLEERQKEMMELWKSDTDEDPEEKEPEKLDESSNIDNGYVENGKVDNDNLDETVNEMANKSANDHLLTESLKADGNTAKVENDNIDEEKNNINETTVDIATETREAVNTKENIADKVVANFNNMDAVNNVENNKSVDGIKETANDSMNSSTSNAEISLVYNDSIEETENARAHPHNNEGDLATERSKELENHQGTEADSQLVSLHYDTENMDVVEKEPQPSTSKDLSDAAFDEVTNNDFSDDDIINMDEIDNLIENAEILKVDNNDTKFMNSPMLINDHSNSTMKPKLTGAPGMVIDLDGTDAVARKRLTGLELLKERFTYFARLKTPEELEREKEKKCKPGAQHLKLKQELEDKIAKQRSLEWAKRLEEEKRQQMEMDAVRGNESEDEIDKIEAKLDGKGETVNEETSEAEESEGEEEMQEVKEKPRKKNPMIDDEAEVSDDEEGIDQNEDEEEKAENDGAVEADEEENNDEESDDSSDESSDSEGETETKRKKGRILKAFEDSDEEVDVPKEKGAEESNEDPNENKISIESQVILESQDEVLQLAQRHKSGSDDLFTSQESAAKTQTNVGDSTEEPDIGTQSFSILNATNTTMAMDLDDPVKLNVPETQQTYHLNDPEKLNVITESQPSDDVNLDAVVGMCSGSFPQNLAESQLPTTGLPVEDKLSVISETQPNEPNLDAVVGMCSGSFTQNLATTQPPASQPIGEDLLNLCTGKFYDNQFVSQTDTDTTQKNNDEENTELQIQPTHSEKNNDEENTELQIQPTHSEKNNDEENTELQIQPTHSEKNNDEENTELQIQPTHSENNNDEANTELQIQPTQTEKPKEKIIHDENLKSILDELNDPEYEETRPKKFFMDNSKEASNVQFKKKFIIDSDDEANNDTVDVKLKKKVKKKKLEKRALQISDDEEDEYEEELEDEEQDYLSDAEGDADRLVEYDSEENEIEIQPLKEKKKNKMAEFFEREAELSDEEWAGSGDEDEADLDTMEKEAGDDDTFHQGRLQQELGQIHMRDVLDQDKREVRLLQELLFEDGDLGDGHRQRKFRWRNADGEEETGIVPDELADTQEEEMESEEQWRKQRHERELFLRQMQKQDEEELNVSINRTTIIKANLTSRTMSSILSEAKNCVADRSEAKIDSPVVLEKKTSKDIPSPKKAFAVFQKSYHGSLLSMGNSSLARLGALAAPLAEAEPRQLPANSKRNFVFAQLSQPDPEVKVTKRKAETNVGTPRLVKKMKTEEQKKPPRSSLLDHLKV